MNLTIDATNVETIKKDFLRIANEILNRHILEVASKQYRVSHIEFYFYNEASHPDENTHALKYQRAKERQLLNGKWYLHKKTINPRCNFKGIDLTCGDGESFCGILIKEVIDLETDTRFSQSKFIDELIAILQPPSNETFLEIIEEDEKIKFQEFPLEAKEIQLLPRKGLSKDSFKNSHYAFKLKK